MNISKLQNEILELKAKTNTVILAHTYQAPEIIEIADITGDSFALSKAAARTRQQRVIMCGVRFMAETVKILSPEKTVILPVPSSTCPMAEQILPSRVVAFRAEHPCCAVVAYINTTAELKAVSDVCVTSSSALKIVSAIENDEILFIPDKNLGSWVKEKLPSKNIILMDGYCPVHNSLTEAQVIRAKAEHPDALLAIHPECTPDVVKHADMIGSTAEIIDFALKSDRPVIIGTERGVADKLKKDYPERSFYYLEPEVLVCQDMKAITLEAILAALKGEGGEAIELDEQLRLRAKKSIDEMLRLGQ